MTPAPRVIRAARRRTALRAARVTALADAVHTPPTDDGPTHADVLQAAADQLRAAQTRTPVTPDPPETPR